MKNKQNKMMKKSILLILMILGMAQVGKAQVNITVDTGMAWVGYMNVFDSVGSVYQFGSAWGLADLKTVVDPGNGSMQLKPNYNLYDASDPYWSNGLLGNKVCEATTYIEDIALLGQTVNFDGFIDSFDLNSGYVLHAFVKVLDANNGYATVLSDYDTISATGTFSTSLVIPNTAGFIPQYGFTVWGLNANPADEAAFGKALIRGNNAPPSPPINVTFQVQSPDSIPVFVFGSWSGWSNFPGEPMTSIGNDTYEAVVQLNATDTVEYLFVSGTATETLDPNDGCTNGNTMFTNRRTGFGSADTTVCYRWQSCASCIPVSVNNITKENMNILVSTNFINLQTSSLSEVDGIEIFDLVGKKVYSSNGSALTNQRIDVDLKSNTLYMIRVQNGEQYHTVKTIIAE